MKENMAPQSKWNAIAPTKIPVIEFFITSDDAGTAMRVVLELLQSAE